MLPEGAPILCGRADGAFRAAIRGQAICEYGEATLFLERNSALTAEGGISLLLGRRPAALRDTPCLLLGAGRLANALSDLLHGLHAPVTVMARRSLGPLAGGHVPLPLSELAERIGDFPVIINTVPVPLLTPAILSRAKRGSLLLELSAVPHVVDTDVLLALGIEYIPAPALPGRYAPRSAGEAVAEAVAAFLS
jgi:dipicolinate synthase subunit A